MDSKQRKMLYCGFGFKEDHLNPILFGRSELLLRWWWSDILISLNCWKKYVFNDRNFSIPYDIKELESFADITLEIINEYNDEICLISILNDSAKRKLEGLQLWS